MTAEQEKKKNKSNISSTNASAKMCAHNTYARINKAKRDTVDFHNWGYKTSCLKLNLESDNRMARAESAGGESKTKGPCRYDYQTNFSGFTSFS